MLSTSEAKAALAEELAALAHLEQELGATGGSAQQLLALANARADLRKAWSDMIEVIAAPDVKALESTSKSALADIDAMRAAIGQIVHGVPTSAAEPARLADVGAGRIADVMKQIVSTAQEGGTLKAVELSGRTSAKRSLIPWRRRGITLNTSRRAWPNKRLRRKATEVTRNSCCWRSSLRPSSLRPCRRHGSRSISAAA